MIHLVPERRKPCQPAVSAPRGQLGQPMLKLEGHNFPYSGCQRQIVRIGSGVESVWVEVVAELLKLLVTVPVGLEPPEVGGYFLEKC